MAQYERNFVTIPKDLSEIKRKFVFNLTKRQFVCFGIGVLLGFPVFYLTKDVLGLTTAVVLMSLVAAPALLCGIYEKNGLHFEDIIKNRVRFYKKPRTRTYQSENIYMLIADLMEYRELEKKLQVTGQYKPNHKRSSYGKKNSQKSKRKKSAF